MSGSFRIKSALLKTRGDDFIIVGMCKDIRNDIRKDINIDYRLPFSGYFCLAFCLGANRSWEEDWDDMVLELLDDDESCFIIYRFASRLNTLVLGFTNMQSLQMVFYSFTGF